MEIERVLGVLRESGVEYADIRVVDRLRESIKTENLKVENIDYSQNKGAGIRVIWNGSLGFACTQDMKNLEATALNALEIAKASNQLQKERICLSEKPVVEDHYTTPIKIDPFGVSKADKLELLFNAEKAMQQAAQLSRTCATLNFQKEEKIFADTEGSYITQTLYESGAGIEAVAQSAHDTQVRSYPNSFRGNHGTAGYEYILSLQLVENAPIIAQEAEALVKAEECPSGYYDLVIDGPQLALQIHESIGHPVELDRIFGSEAAYAGGSFLGPYTYKQNFRYGSEFVTVVADATVPGGLGTFGYDDDGVKGQKTVIIDKGILRNYLTSRDTAAKIGEVSNGTNRADGWKNMPIVRMTNINLRPGDYELDDLISGVENGLYLSTNKSWSIDDKRMNFQFACEIAYEIKDGRLTGKIYKNPIYTGITPVFWGSCDGVCSEKYFKMFGTPNCGKGEPSQVAHVGHGAAPARFRNVKVGVRDVK